MLGSWLALLPLSHRYGLGGQASHAPEVPVAAASNRATPSLGAAAGVLPAALGAPSAVYNWSAMTQLKGGARRGDVMLLLHDCVGVADGRRLRIGTGTDSEEEGVVRKLSCPTRGLGPENPRDATGAAVGGRPANALLPASVQQSQQSQQANGITFPHLPVVGVAQLAYALLHDHEQGAAVMQYPAAKPLPPACPSVDGLVCSGLGSCDEARGTCGCVAGRNGTACELRLCAADCAGRGACLNGTCACAAGWDPRAACAKRACAADCSGHGMCQDDGTCRCDALWSGPTAAPCSVQGAGCPNGCSHHGRCVQGNCACHHGWVGASCHQAVANLASSCPQVNGTGCAGNGLCVDSECSCYTGFYGETCEDFCPSNCSFNGRCSMAYSCVCHTGFGGPDCSVECANRCSGHGDCNDGACSCYDGYTGTDCSTIVGITVMQIMQSGLRAELPLVAVVLVLLLFLVVCFVLAHVRNLLSGKFGLAAVPLYDFFMKKWRNAPIYEPVYYVQKEAPQAGRLYS